MVKHIFKDTQNIIERTRNYAYKAVNVAMVQHNWLLGKRIADEEFQGRIELSMARKLSNDLPTTSQIFMVKDLQKAISISLFSFISSSLRFSMR